VKNFDQFYAYLLEIVLCFVVIIIIIIIGSATHEECFPPSEVSPTFPDSWLLPASSLFPASFHPYSFHLSNCARSSDLS
jgi:hypothetical protein